jgi:hypothetical protein
MAELPFNFQVIPGFQDEKKDTKFNDKTSSPNISEIRQVSSSGYDIPRRNG